MSGSSVRVGIFDPDVNIHFACYESVINVDPFREPYKLLNMQSLDPFYSRQTGFVAQYVSAGSLFGRVPVRALEFREWDIKLIITARDEVCLAGESFHRYYIYLVRVFNK